jgi:hypothetical protein
VAFLVVKLRWQEAALCGLMQLRREELETLMQQLHKLGQGEKPVEVQDVSENTN